MHPLILTMILLLALGAIRKVSQWALEENADEKAQKIQSLIRDLETLNTRWSTLKPVDEPINHALNIALKKDRNEISQKLEKLLGVKLNPNLVFSDDCYRYGGPLPPGPPGVEGGSETVEICRVPGGDLKDQHTISVPRMMVGAYLFEGGTLGPCPPPPPDLTPEEVDEKLARGILEIGREFFRGGDAKVDECGEC